MPVHMLPADVSEAIRILAVDDHPTFRKGLAAIINGEPGMCVAGEAGTVAEAVRNYRELRPDIVLMDLRLPDGGGVDAITEICHLDSEARVIVLTTFDADEDIYRALQAGARGYLLKDLSAEELAGAIRAVHAGQRCIPAGIASRLAARIGRPDFSERELEVLTLLCQGKSNKEIAAQLHIGEETIKTHFKSIFQKLGVNDRTAAAVLALRHGLVKGP